MLLSLRTEGGIHELRRLTTSPRRKRYVPIQTSLASLSGSRILRRHPAPCVDRLISSGSKGTGLSLLVLAVILILVPFLKRANSEFAVTNKRIIVKLGFSTTRTVELLHSKVEAISVNQGLLGKMLGYGDIVVTGTGGTREEFKAVASPLELRRAVRQQQHRRLDA